MTTHKSLKNSFAHLSLKSKKGSTYGEASKALDCYSFQYTSRSNQSVYSNRVKVLYSQTPILT